MNGYTAGGGPTRNVTVTDGHTPDESPSQRGTDALSSTTGGVSVPATPPLVPYERPAPLAPGIKKWLYDRRWKKWREEVQVDRTAKPPKRPALSSRDTRRWEEVWQEGWTWYNGRATPLRATEIDNDVLEYRDALLGAVRNESQQLVMTITVTQSKGGVGKSPTSANVASHLGERSRRSLTAIDNNELRGTLAQDLGIDPRLTMTVRSLQQKRRDGKIGTPREYSGQLGGTKHGVQVLASDAPDQRTTLYSYEQSYECIALAQDYSVFVVNDTGNHIQGDAMQAALQLSDVVIVPHFPGSQKSLKGFVDTMNDYAKWGHAGLMRHSIAVVTGLRPGELIEDYREKLKLSPEHILMAVPWDERIADEKPVDLDLTPLFTEIAYLEITLASIRVRRYTMDVGSELPRIDILNDSPDVVQAKLGELNKLYEERQNLLKDKDQLGFKQGHMVDLPHGRAPVLPYAPYAATV